MTKKQELYDAVNRLFNECDYRLTINVGGINLSLYDAEEDGKSDNIWNCGIVANGKVYTVDALYNKGKGPGTYAQLFRGDYDIIDGLADEIFNDNVDNFKDSEESKSIYSVMRYKYAGLCAEAILDAVKENNTAETTKNVAETLNMLLDKNFPKDGIEWDDEANDIKDLAHRHVFRASQIANTYNSMNMPINPDDTEFWGHIKELIEHQDD